VIVGWDIGGAHVKAVMVANGRVVDGAQWSCPLWQGLGQLDAVFAQARVRWGALQDARQAVTMSGEMVDLFPSREAGVGEIARHVDAALGPAVQFYTGGNGFCDALAATSRWREIASANWLATANWVAAHVSEAILVDIGSTTSDLVPVRSGLPCPTGRSDHERLVSGELVYLGVVRTPLCCLGRRVPFGAASVNVMNEWFATSADVFRLRGELDPAHDQYPPADGGSKDAATTCRRLARMVGLDGHEVSSEVWRALADHWAMVMRERIAASLGGVMLRAGLSAQAPVVAAGCGAFLARQIANREARACVEFSELVPGDRAWADVCAPAAALALLLDRWSS